MQRDDQISFADPVGTLSGPLIKVEPTAEGVLLAMSVTGRPKKVVVPPTPHTESVTGKVNADRIALSGGASADRERPDDDPPASPRPVVRRITMPSRDDER